MQHAIVLPPSTLKVGGLVSESWEHCFARMFTEPSSAQSLYQAGVLLPSTSKVGHLVQASRGPFKSPKLPSTEVHFFVWGGCDVTLECTIKQIISTRSSKKKLNLFRLYLPVFRRQIGKTLLFIFGDKLFATQLRPRFRRALGICQAAFCPIKINTDGISV